MPKKTKTGKITIDNERCKACYLCISVCPKELIEVSDKLNQKGYYPAVSINNSGKDKDRNCTGCTQCALVCPEVAIEVYRAK
ncbi:MAG: 4Fe-4S dicluster domain-containing protein [Desulfobacterales bacterium]|nr:4Fe-4S dicluster domain-containing protein [Desulfobacterales bacterium]